MRTFGDFPLVEELSVVAAGVAVGAAFLVGEAFLRVSNNEDEVPGRWAYREMQNLKV